MAEASVLHDTPANVVKRGISDTVFRLSFNMSLRHSVHISRFMLNNLCSFCPILIKFAMNLKHLTNISLARVMPPCSSNFMVLTIWLIVHT